jgi:cytidylate kinase
VAVLIAIDGPSGAGKSTVARALAQRLGFTYLDTGAMYRCVGLLSLDEPAQPLGQLARAAHIELDGEKRNGEEREGRILLDGHNVTDAIRTPDVAQAASRAAADPQVRAALVAKQQELVARGDWVAEGRDIGTVVAPAAELKVFLTASPQERARRRAAELGLDVKEVLAEQAQRDERDATREHDPLRAADGAMVLDSTALSTEEVIERIQRAVERIARAA